jgi:hypothetical protein
MIGMGTVLSVALVESRGTFATGSADGVRLWQYVKDETYGKSLQVALCSCIVGS